MFIVFIEYKVTIFVFSVMTRDSIALRTNAMLDVLFTARGGTASKSDIKLNNIDFDPTFTSHTTGIIFHYRMLDNRYYLNES